MPLANLVARIEGTRSDLRGQPVVLLAHLDHLGRGWPDVREANAGQVHPGADDNASGVAVVLEVARAMALEPPRARPVLFAIVTGEEAGRLGSKHLLDFLAPAGPPFACVNLDTVGRLREGKLHVLNADSAREWRFIFMGVQATTGLESTIVPEPLDSSDQISCIERGVPAVQLFTGPHADYHRPGDTADKVDAEGLARIAEAVHEVVTYLADRAEPLTVTIAGSEGAPSTGAAGRRRVSLGTMPDFSFGGPGVRVQEVLPGSPAESSGLRAGDVVVALDGSPVADLRAYSDLLSRRKPGDEVEVTAERGSARITVRVRLEAR
jgi:Zn-dependent M28 family amino/carboxypeptidase